MCGSAWGIGSLAPASSAGARGAPCADPRQSSTAAERQKKGRPRGGALLLLFLASLQLPASANCSCVGDVGVAFQDRRVGAGGRGDPDDFVDERVHGPGEEN